MNTSSLGLSLRDVSSSYGRHRVLDHLYLTAGAGRVYGLLGLNGAGKSTLFNAVLGLVPYQGTIEFDGRPVDLRDVGATVNGPALYPQLSARRNLLVHALITGTDPARIDEVLGIVGLDAGRTRAGAFSTGMKVRLAIAIALLTDPPLLILDEPQNGLDPQGIVELRELIRCLANEGKTVLISSHQLGEVAHMVDDIGVLASGRLVFEGPLDSLADTVDGLESAFFRLVSGERR
ncbi:ATP-binding cassette domain-containing protein [Corynebacterium uterequi]|uniref:ABC-type multidrug transport system, ATPase component n=1 Tax=Corynebacterium uterequi TaxID=1072256 RepID=A0A0G3HGT4_9CORY|nr:ATP-binding cassette domain-containing protein [Corynebacterium uterequi]AKK10352.1 ABC-type multidrug transport system, ATPase component [Corynebacterium uterequi]